ncbi:MAG TPA: chemotaxis protein CheW [Anaeromyxobacter sp.]
MSSATEVTERQQYLSFSLAGGDYAVGILKVKEILQCEDITKVPATPRSIRGVINLRGGVVPVVDLAVKFGLPEASVTKRTCVLVMETAFDGVPAVVGVVADAVSEVIDLADEDIEAPPSFGTGVRVDYLRGMGKVGRGLVLLLDIDRLLSADERELAASLEREDPAPEAIGDPPPMVAEAQAAPGAEGAQVT